MAAVRRAPRLAGLNIPNMANEMVIANMEKIWMPEPITAANNLQFDEIFYFVRALTGDNNDGNLL